MKNKHTTFPFLLTQKQVASAMKRTTHSIGRPRLPKSERRSIQVSVRFNRSQAMHIKREAKRCRQTISQWVREKALNRAREILNPSTHPPVGMGFTRHIHKKTYKRNGKVYVKLPFGGREICLSDMGTFERIKM